jgi:hypothetical protein
MLLAETMSRVGQMTMEHLHQLMMSGIDLLIMLSADQPRFFSNFSPPQKNEDTSVTDQEADPRTTGSARTQMSPTLGRAISATFPTIKNDRGGDFGDMQQ